MRARAVLGEELVREPFAVERLDQFDLHPPAASERQRHGRLDVAPAVPVRRADRRERRPPRAADRRGERAPSPRRDRRRRTPPGRTPPPTRASNASTAPAMRAEPRRSGDARRCSGTRPRLARWGHAARSPRPYRPARLPSLPRHDDVRFAVRRTARRSRSWIAPLKAASRSSTPPTSTRSAAT